MSQVTGITGGEAKTVVAAHTIEGGAGNSGPQYKADKISNTNIDRCQGVTTIGDIKGDRINISNGGPQTNSVHTQPVAQTTQKAIEDYTVQDIVELLEKEGFPQPILKKFEEHRIDGKYFNKDLIEDGVLEDLGVKTPLHKMKLKTLINKLSPK